MSGAARILVATDVVGDANLVRKLLHDEFANVAGSTDPDRAIADFEKHRPEVLILAFDGLEKAEIGSPEIVPQSGWIGLIHRKSEALRVRA